MAKIGWIGLGVMGRPMARNLLAAGHDVVVNNRSQPAVDDLVAQGARAADTPAQVAADCEVIFLCVPDSPDVELVMLGEQGVLTAVRQGAVIVDCSTIRPDTARQMAKAAQARGAWYLDAPISGGERGAIDGTLSVMVGGDQGAFEQVRPLLDVVGRTVAHVGSSGAGQTVKAVNQLMVAGILALVSEGILLLESSEVDMDRALELLGGGLASSRILEMKSRDMIARDFTPGFRAELQVKDQTIVSDTVRQAGLALPVHAIVAQLMAATKAAGDGKLDHSAVLRTLERLAGRHAEHDA